MVKQSSIRWHPALNNDAEFKVYYLRNDKGQVFGTLTWNNSVPHIWRITSGSLVSLGSVTAKGYQDATNRAKTILVQYAKDQLDEAQKHYDAVSSI